MATRADVEAVRTDIRALRADIRAALDRQTWRLGGLVGIAAGVAVAIVKLA